MTYPIIILLAVLVIAGLSLALYRTGFRLRELKLKWGFGEAKLERAPDAAPDAGTPEEPPTPPTATTAEQRATQGGVIRRSSIRAPADSGAQATQQASGQGSRIEDTSITLE